MRMRCASPPAQGDRISARHLHSNYNLKQIWSWLRKRILEIESVHSNLHLAIFSVKVDQQPNVSPETLHGLNYLPWQVTRFRLQAGLATRLDHGVIQPFSPFGSMAMSNKTFESRERFKA